MKKDTANHHGAGNMDPTMETDIQRDGVIGGDFGTVSTPDLDATPCEFHYCSQKYGPELGFTERKSCHQAAVKSSDHRSTINGTTKKISDQGSTINGSANKTSDLGSTIDRTANRTPYPRTTNNGIAMGNSSQGSSINASETSDQGNNVKGHTRNIIQAKRTVQQARDSFIIVQEQKPDGPKSIVSNDSAIWMSSSSTKTTSPMDNTDPEQENNAPLCSGKHSAPGSMKADTSGDCTKPSTLVNNTFDSDVPPTEVPNPEHPFPKRNPTPYGASKEQYSLGDQTSRRKRTNDARSVDEFELMKLSQNLTKLNFCGSRSSKRRSQQQTEKQLHQKLQVSLENLSPEELKELYICQDKDGDNLLMIAIIEGCTSLAKSLIRLVPSADLLDVRNKLGQTALHLSVITHQRRMTRKLVLAGASLQSLDFLGNTPLHVACSNNDLDSVVSLTKLVTCLECPEKAKRQSLVVPQPSELYNFKGQTCLHIAAQNGFTHLVKYLVETQFRADVNAPERLCGKTVLHIAAELGNLDLVEYLLSLDQTDQDAVTYARLSALDLAVGRGQDRVGKVLEQAGVTAQIAQQVMPEEEDQEDEEEERNLWTLQDFQCSVIANSTRQEPLEYDDLCVGGKPLQSLQSLM